jgi:hypothetical protein
VWAEENTREAIFDALAGCRGVRRTVAASASVKHYNGPDSLKDVIDGLTSTSREFTERSLS